VANLLTSGLAYNPYFYAQSALQVLYKRLGMAFYVNRSIERDKGSAKGDTIQLRRPKSRTPQNMPIALASFADVTPDYTNLVINQWMGDGFRLTDKEKTLTPEMFVTEHIAPVAAGIADQIDQNLSSLFLEVPWINAADGTTPTNDFGNIRLTLLNNKAPLVSERDYAYQTDAIIQSRYEKSLTFLQANTATDAALQREGQLGIKFGFRIFPNQNAPTYASGTGALTSPVVTAAVGATTINITGSAGSGTLKRGTVLTITGDPQLYAVTADSAVAAGGTTATAISPAIAQTATGATVAFTQTASNSIGGAFHRNAFALVLQPLEDAGPGIISATVTDPITNLSMRSRVWGDGGSGATFWALDALWGYKTLNPNLAVRNQI
jgi:hypothetical protein